MASHQKMSSLSKSAAQLQSSSPCLPSSSVAEPDKETLDLEREATELMLREAAEMRQRYIYEGIGAYSPGQRKPRTDKRFLVNVIKQVDSHNQVVLKQEARDARKRRLKEGGKMHSHRYWDRSPERVNRRTTARSGKESRDERNYQREDSYRSRRRSISPSTRYKSSSTASRSKESHMIVLSDDDHSSTADRPRKDTIVESKMDRYFRKDYDPRLDIESHIPAEGLIPDFGDLLEYASNVKSKSHSSSVATSREEGKAAKKSSKKSKKKHKEKRKHKRKRKEESETDDSSDDRGRKSTRKSHRQHKRRHRSLSTDSSSSSTSSTSYERASSSIPSKPIATGPIREWDQAKLAGSWDPDVILHNIRVK
ncbi:hypothetical protein BDF22DRAFT_778398 [Syncephalis plumigaleata]|nr:hypothetical protein BDF22DRAFT_778398 [Syncephalis plumigaleata]